MCKFNIFHSRSPSPANGFCVILILFSLWNNIINCNNNKNNKHQGKKNLWTLLIYYFDPIFACTARKVPLPYPSEWCYMSVIFIESLLVSVSSRYIGISLLLMLLSSKRTTNHCPDWDLELFLLLLFFMAFAPANICKKQQQQQQQQYHSNTNSNICMLLASFKFSTS